MNQNTNSKETEMPRSTLLAVTFAAATVIAGCTPSATTQAPATGAAAEGLQATLSGRTLSNDNGEINLGTNGRMSGTVRGAPFAGAWTVRNEQFCRTITQPARVAGTECQDVTFNDDGTVTIDGVNGPVTWALS